MTPTEALARIAALPVHDPDDRGGDTYDADEVRAVLAEVTPERPKVGTEFTPGHPMNILRGQPGCTLDRDQARDALLDYDQAEASTDQTLDALARCVRPATIDRDALLDLMEEHIDGIVRGGKGPFADAILALVRPAAGVTLTPDEVRTARDALVLARVTPRHPRFDELRARLEAAQ